MTPPAKSKFLSDRYMKPFLVALAGVLSVRLANAATITITSGGFTFSGPVAGFSAASGRLIGAGFDLDGGVRNSNPDCGFGGCSGGFSYLIDASLVNELALGNVRIGNGPPDVFASFNQIESFRFTGPSIDIPHTAAPSITLTGPFSFVGRIPITLFTKLKLPGKLKLLRSRAGFDFAPCVLKIEVAIGGIDFRMNPWAALVGVPVGGDELLEAGGGHVKRAVISSLIFHDRAPVVGTHGQIAASKFKGDLAAAGHDAGLLHGFPELQHLRQREL